MFASLWLTAVLSAGVLAGQPTDDLFSRLDANGDGRIERSETPEAHASLVNRLLRKADSDGDGLLDAQEFSQGLRPVVEAKPIEEARSTAFGDFNATRVLLLKLDTDKDTRLTRGEAPGALRGVYDQLIGEFDATKDGVLDPRELAQAGPKLQRQAQKVAQQQRWDLGKELAALERTQGELADRFDAPPSARQVVGDPARARVLFTQLDENGDGMLVLDELPAPLKERVGSMLRRADRNNDRAVSLEEFLSASDRLGKLSRPGDATKASPQAQAGPTADQASPASKKKSGPPEASGDARVAKAASGNSTQQAAEQLISKMIERADADGNGVLERREATGRLANRFRQADANGDGRLDRREIQRMTEALAARLDREAKNPQKPD
ncbi:transaldolase/EF-hand domain-containing protein [Pirellulimonas nuda]|uniref:Transaldolase/EF-hand domain-containing protein n=1 Tax=Pirellulimonas nuda TaxID=2528009 RepID=A0A518D9J2_9BACT|nr:hypothetical protein [Pirellulimonas nuda]QDU88150.1 transaldolase/EF-hand domain-containing protein [Pirellulimonas nuda]